MSTEELVRELAKRAGITVDGPEPFDIRVNDRRFYRRVLAGGSLGLGESYMEGWWDCDDLVELSSRIAVADLETGLKGNWRLIYEAMKARFLNLQSRKRTPIVGRQHYDTSIDPYRAMTDKWITLSCGYWADADGLDEAQEAKLEMICKKIRVGERDRVLDIGCGFGSFARYAAQKFGCTVVAINLSGEQLAVARELGRGLPVEFVQCDYRDTDEFLSGGKFDKIVSAGMFEHVGIKNYGPYMEVAHDSLNDGGLFLLHTVGGNVSTTANDPWFDKYIFPNGMIPSIRQIGHAIEGLFVMEDWHNFGPDYDKTLRAWHERFDGWWSEPKSDPFYRMWTYYLLVCAGQFRSRKKQLWQVLLSKGGASPPFSRPA